MDNNFEFTFHCIHMNVFAALNLNEPNSYLLFEIWLKIRNVQP